jgi:predicted PurR-regulated permease PerM
VSRADAPDESIFAPDVDPTAEATPAIPGAPQPDIARTGEAIESRTGGSVAVTLLAVLAVLYSLYFARAFLRPIVYALLLDFLFSPVVRALNRVRVRPPLGAGIVVVALIALIALGAYELSGPVQGWAARAPETVGSARVKLGKFIRPLERVSKTAEQVAGAVRVAEPAKPPEVVVLRGPGLLSRIFGTTQRLLVSIFEIVVLLYFLLAGGDLFLQKLIKVLPNVSDRQTAIQVARAIEASISTFLLTAAVVNAAEGFIVAGAMYVVGMPNPTLWGALVFVLEFIPYLGAVTMFVVLTVAALTAFDTVSHALLPPMTFLVINLIQGNLVSPMLLGHRLALNPVAIFVGLAFWSWVWGVPGAFIAVPMLAAFKIFCDHVESLAAVGEFLGRRDEGERRAMVRLT